MREWAQLGRSIANIKEGAEIPALLRSYKDKNFQDEAKKALAAIADESKPEVAFRRLK
ncbi:MAG: hypothetical protein RRC34_15980 [Lentisphaeria bacterium]|nr:hypothetical protein [Lentisphaeria bacterium]